MINVWYLIYCIYEVHPSYLIKLNEAHSLNLIALFNQNTCIICTYVVRGVEIC